jgi:chromosome segregation ATPase
VRPTLDAAAVDDDIARELLAARLVREPEPAGFGTLLAHAEPATSNSATKEKPVGRRAAGRARRVDGAARSKLREAKETLRAAEDEEREAQQRLARAQRELEKARTAVEKAQRELDRIHGD